MNAEVRAPATDGELEEVAHVFRRSFNGTQELFDEFLATADRDRVAVAFVDGRVAAATNVLPFGVFLGGGRVGVGGYSPVAVAPEHRGRGLGRLVSAAPFADLRERGEPLAGLFPASTRLYRGVGFEVAGTWTERQITSRLLLGLPPAPGVVVRRAGPDDLAAVTDCYDRIAPSRHGYLDRPGSWWRRVAGDGADDRHLYVVDGQGGSVDAYVLYRHVPAAVDSTIKVREVIAATAEHACALWRLVGSSSTQATTTSFAAAPEHPLVLLLPEQDDRPAPAQVPEIRPMYRVVDLPAAVAARGFPAGLRATVDLELADAWCPWHEGRWRLVVEGGSGRAERGGAGTVRLGPNGLAPLFTGYAPASTLAAVGLLGGAGDAPLAALDAAFAGPPPFCPDTW